MDFRNSRLNYLLFGKNRSVAPLEGEDMLDAFERRKRENDIIDLEASSFRNHPLVQRFGLDKNPAVSGMARLASAAHPKAAKSLLGGDLSQASRDLHEGFSNPKVLASFDKQTPISKEETERVLTGVVGGLGKKSSLEKWHAKTAAEKLRVIDKLKGGLGDSKPDSAFPLRELKKGIKHEQEHTKDRAIAREIAKDHLAERSDYYTALDKAKIGSILYSFE